MTDWSPDKIKMESKFQHQPTAKVQNQISYK